MRGRISQPHARSGAYIPSQVGAGSAHICEVMSQLPLVHSSPVVQAVPLASSAAHMPSLQKLPFWQRKSGQASPDAGSAAQVPFTMLFDAPLQKDVPVHSSSVAHMPPEATLPVNISSHAA